MGEELPLRLFNSRTGSFAEFGVTVFDRLDEAMLKQAYAESKAVERITGLAVEPLLVFSQAYLMKRAVARSRGVTILPARMLPRFLASRPQGIPAARVAAVHASLAAALDDLL